MERWEHLPDLPTGAFYISKPAERKLSLVIRRHINAQLYKGKDSLNLCLSFCSSFKQSSPQLTLIIVD